MLIVCVSIGLAASTNLFCAMPAYRKISVATSNNNNKVIIKSGDMNDEMREYAIENALYALNVFRFERDVATYLKAKFDEEYGPTWHCIVGWNYGTHVEYENEHYIHFTIAKMNITLFKCG